MAAYTIDRLARRRDLLTAIGGTTLAGIALAGLARSEHLPRGGAQHRPLLVAKALHAGDVARPVACPEAGA